VDTRKQLIYRRHHGQPHSEEVQPSLLLGTLLTCVDWLQGFYVQGEREVSSSMWLGTGRQTPSVEQSLGTSGVPGSWVQC
jgi:hypothetical protein